MGWAEMEALATAMTQARYDKQRKVEEKLKKIRQFNKKHPIAPTSAIIVYQAKPDTNVIAIESARWIGGYHAKILGAFGFGSKKK